MNPILTALVRSFSSAAWLAAAVAACSVAARAQSMEAAAGSTDITPSRPVYMAGYGMNRKSSGAHDRLRARAIVIRSGQTTVAMVACDVLGLPHYQIERIRDLIHSVPRDSVLISATHTHSGPDTLGQWGPDIQTSGVDRAWMDGLVASVASLVDSLTSRLAPASLRFANTTDVKGISKNVRVPRILDTELTVMQAVGADGKTIGTLVNYACHPEILNNHELTADFPHWLYETVEKRFGGTCIYVNGAQGGMITADYDEKSAPPGQNWHAAEELGTRLGQHTIAIIAAAKSLASAPLTVQHASFEVPLENQRFRALVALHVFPASLLHNGSIPTEVNRVTMGPAEFLSIPGEALPNIGFYLKRRMTGQYKFLMGLTGDELGYILTPQDYALELYAYETSVSVGESVEPLMTRNLLGLMRGSQPPGH